ncbi:MAG TPA: type III polyketide synthase [Capsulimonadaceae bacterium]
MPTNIEGIGTANPPFSKSQREAAAFLKRVEGMPESVRSRIDVIHDRSAIERRFTCISDYNREPADYEFYPPNASMQPPPSTAARNAMYRKWAPVIAEQAARKALAESGRDADEITHLIVVSCTGFYSPGVDVHLVRSLKLRPTTERTMIGFMGCYAAFNAMKTAHAICGSNPAARVLIVCVELCTLHFQPVTTLESAVVSALFADGAAAAVMSATPDEAQSGLRYVDSMSLLDGDSLGDMTWDIGDTGFLMTLSARVPAVIERHLCAFVDQLTRCNGISASDIKFWAIHPGGRQILDRAASVLEMPTDALAESYGVLREYGNMSSPTILFILERMRARNVAKGYGVALAFGPGLTIEGCLLRA